MESHTKTNDGCGNCQNGATCLMGKCICRVGFTGVKCQEREYLYFNLKLNKYLSEYLFVNLLKFIYIQLIHLYTYK